MPNDRDRNGRASDDPKLRHEFVGMMFAVAVGEIGLQTAALVQAGHVLHYLPAYSHLFLATIVVAASWVGWSRSRISGARQDVTELFEWAFVVLLLDMSMVVTYFILVRTVDFSDEHHRIDSAAAVAFWHVVIFGLYLAWDFVTKFLMYERPDTMGWWKGSKQLDAAGKQKRRDGIRRIVPTVICLVIASRLWIAFTAVIDERLLTADFALFSVVLLFRALKSLDATIWWRSHDTTGRRLLFRIGCAVICFAGFILGTWMTLRAQPLPHLGFGVVQAIRTPVPGEAP